jgi:hypothetical protein
MRFKYCLILFKIMLHSPLSLIAPFLKSKCFIANRLKSSASNIALVLTPNVPTLFYVNTSTQQVRSRLYKNAVLRQNLHRAKQQLTQQLRG